ncbi:Ent3p KNAG_0M00380 [Huiozyma naganishii CBS 8797]|uniref:ENTH domain-containing protein n=1 Tax=Huiozyma naganishii (strain ATCC MYA-139 / BCRC 22969 / CBS 8797 / KCTC 17520 / NBRC 10181 / NCYC 3082 / Yp74L-3) TaxID=1071383 RepID=J7SBA4_HUIN7|nr:hypothetical protein KNAG_0M00380 [Kazachstania naganishii CBS 8797]CCK72891.1 hypothetical protein KNAG_0M00380 [Kazachstania naganishii CBS 8797]
MSLEDTLANMTLYDAKKYFRKAQNVVFNFTEMESKVREATNNEPWGASSTLMEQIAQGTYNYKEREEVMMMLMRRFTEKAGSEWRQIYKALQLLDYLIRRGSEKFIDDVRAALRIVRLLESFHYIDSQGRDQGVNVRNRAKQIVELLQDDAAVRDARKKARETAKKYKGVAGGATALGAGGSSTAGAMNPHAGFNASTSHGISVSADFDTDDEAEVEPASAARPIERFTLEPSPPPAALQRAQAQTQEADDDDDEFSEFQSAAAPTTSTQQATTPASNTINNTSSNLLSLDLHTSQSTMPSSMPSSMPQKQPAKAGDPFSSLFNTAKSLPEDPARKPAPAVVSTTTVESSPRNRSGNHQPTAKPAPVPAASQNDDDDDLFGELTSSSAAGTRQDTGDVDLLSF